MLIAGAEEMGRRVRPADEEMEVVIPRVADAAVGLDALPRAVNRGAAGSGLRHVDRTSLVGVVGVDRHCRVRDSRVGSLDGHGHVGEFVLEGLYVNDRLSKYNAKGKTFFKR